jgi:hypothetical protein
VIPTSSDLSAAPRGQVLEALAVAYVGLNNKEVQLARALLGGRGSDADVSALYQLQQARSTVVKAILGQISGAPPAPGTFANNGRRPGT